MAAEPTFVVGRIGRPHGVRGEVTVLLEVAAPTVYAPGAELHTDDGRALTVRRSSPYRDRGLIVLFAGVDDRTAAERLRGAVITAPTSARPPLDDGEFWPSDLIGLRAVSASGELLGIVTAVALGAGQDRITVTTPAGDDVLVPFVDDLVGDPRDGEMEIRDPGGLFGG